jgi:hypothetical protein
MTVVVISSGGSWCLLWVIGMVSLLWCFCACCCVGLWLLWLLPLLDPSPLWSFSGLHLCGPSCGTVVI